MLTRMKSVQSPKLRLVQGTILDEFYQDYLNQWGSRKQYI